MPRFIYDDNSLPDPAYVRLVARLLACFLAAILGGGIGAYFS